MRTLSSAFLLVLMLGSCGLKAPIYLPKDPLLCLGCSSAAKDKAEAEAAARAEKEKSKVEGQKN